VLVEMGRVLRRCVREVDPVFRYSADDFALLLRGADRQAALHVAERVRRSIETHPFLSREGLDLNLTACIGMASFPDHARSKDALIDLAEAALRRAKREGRNAVQLADAEEVAS
jgi:diguanylate cyclase (GGDEF)-like protein